MPTTDSPIKDNAPELLPNQAVEQYERSTKEDPGNAELFMELGAAYYIAHRWDDAISAFEQAVKLRPDLGHAHYYLGVLYAAKGQKDRAGLELETIQRVSTNPILKAQAKARIPVVNSLSQLAEPDSKGV